jgi:DNA-binding response OmpR family regulator
MIVKMTNKDCPQAQLGQCFFVVDPTVASRILLDAVKPRRDCSMEYRLQLEITTKTSVVVLDDDLIFGTQMSSCLLRDGYTVNSFSDLSKLSQHLDSNHFDIGIFSLDSSESCITHFLNANHLFRNKGIVLITNKIDPSTKVTALKEGADYCLQKPFSMEELSLLTLNLALRVNGHKKQSWVLDRRKWELISPDSRCIKLTNLEQLIVEKLAVGNGGVISKDDIAVALGYSPSNYDFRRLEVIIRRLRNKVKLALGIEIPLKTAHRRGYAFTDNIKVLDF